MVQNTTQTYQSIICAKHMKPSTLYVSSQCGNRSHCEDFQCAVKEHPNNQVRMKRISVDGQKIHIQCDLGAAHI